MVKDIFEDQSLTDAQKYDQIVTARSRAVKRAKAHFFYSSVSPYFAATGQFSKELYSLQDTVAGQGYDTQSIQFPVAEHTFTYDKKNYKLNDYQLAELQKMMNAAYTPRVMKYLKNSTEDDVSRYYALKNARTKALKEAKQKFFERFGSALKLETE